MIDKLLTALQAPYILVEIFASTCGLLGSLALALQGRRAAWGWVLFAFSNVGWLVFGFGYGHWFFLLQQIGFSITSAIGIWNWLIKPAIDQHYERLLKQIMGL